VIQSVTRTAGLRFGELKSSGGEAHRFPTWVFSNPKDPASPTAVILWWERRRLPFNLIVGTFGILCLVIFFAQ
jgi:hypothetical protein